MKDLILGLGALLLMSSFIFGIVYGFLILASYPIHDQTISFLFG